MSNEGNPKSGVSLLFVRAYNATVSANNAARSFFDETSRKLNSIHFSDTFNQSIKTFNSDITNKKINLFNSINYVSNISWSFTQNQAESLLNNFYPYYYSSLHYPTTTFTVSFLDGLDNLDATQIDVDFELDEPPNITLSLPTWQTPTIETSNINYVTNVSFNTTISNLDNNFSLINFEDLSTDKIVTFIFNHRALSLFDFSSNFNDSLTVNFNFNNTFNSNYTPYNNVNSNIDNINIEIPEINTGLLNFSKNLNLFTVDYSTNVNIEFDNNFTNIEIPSFPVLEPIIFNEQENVVFNNIKSNLISPDITISEADKDVLGKISPSLIGSLKLEELHKTLENLKSYYLENKILNTSNETYVKPLHFYWHLKFQRVIDSFKKKQNSLNQQGLYATAQRGWAAPGFTYLKIINTNKEELIEQKNQAIETLVKERLKFVLDEINKFVEYTKNSYEIILDLSSYLFKLNLEEMRTKIDFWRRYMNLCIQEYNNKVEMYRNYFEQKRIELENNRVQIEKIKYLVEQKRALAENELLNLQLIELKQQGLMSSVQAYFLYLTAVETQLNIERLKNDILQGYIQRKESEITKIAAQGQVVSAAVALEKLKLRRSEVSRERERLKLEKIKYELTQEKARIEAERRRQELVFKAKQLDIEAAKGKINKIDIEIAKENARCKSLSNIANTYQQNAELTLLKVQQQQLKLENWLNQYKARNILDKTRVFQSEYEKLRAVYANAKNIEKLGKNYREGYNFILKAQASALYADEQQTNQLKAYALLTKEKAKSNLNSLELQKDIVTSSIIHSNNEVYLAGTEHIINLANAEIAKVEALNTIGEKDIIKGQGYSAYATFLQGAAAPSIAYNKIFVEAEKLRAQHVQTHNENIVNAWSGYYNYAALSTRSLGEKINAEVRKLIAQNEKEYLNQILLSYYKTSLEAGREALKFDVYKNAEAVAFERWKALFDSKLELFQTVASIGGSVSAGAASAINVAMHASGDFGTSESHTDSYNSINSATVEEEQDPTEPRI